MTRAVSQSPSSRIVAAATSIWDVQDCNGRLISLRKLAALDKLRLFKAIGPVLSQNAPYLGMAVLATSVVAIDGVPVPSPATELQLEALISRLGDDGIAAIADGLRGEASERLSSDALGN